MTDPVMNQAVTIQELASQIQQIRTRQTELVGGLDEQIGAIDIALTNFKKGSRRAIWGSYIWHVVHTALAVIIVLAGVSVASIIHRLDDQQLQILSRQAETARIRKEVLCPFYTAVLAYQTTPEAVRAVPPDRRAQYDAGMAMFRNAADKLHCDQ